MGDIILRGEIDAAVRENLDYLSAIKRAVKGVSRGKNAIELLDNITIEACGRGSVYPGRLQKHCISAISVSFLNLHSTV